MTIHSITHSNGEVTLRNSKAFIFTHAVVLYSPKYDFYDVIKYSSSVASATTEANKFNKHAKNLLMYAGVVISEGITAAVVEVQVVS